MMNYFRWEKWAASTDWQGALYPHKPDKLVDYRPLAGPLHEVPESMTLDEAMKKFPKPIEKEE